jgi:hypothetical protein
LEGGRSTKKTKKYVVKKSEFGEYRKAAAPLGFIDVNNPEAPPVLGFEDMVEGETYTPFAPGKTFAESITQLNGAINNRARADEDALCCLTERLTLLCDDPEFMNLTPLPAPARNVYNMTKVAAEKLGRLYDKRSQAATPETVSEATSEIEEHLADNGITLRTGTIVAELDVCMLGEKTVVVGECKSKLTLLLLKEFNEKVEEIKVKAADPNFPNYAALFKDKRILSVAYGSLLADKPALLKFAEENDIQLFGRNGHEISPLPTSSPNYAPPPPPNSDDASAKRAWCDQLKTLLSAGGSAP